MSGDLAGEPFNNTKGLLTAFYQKQSQENLEENFRLRKNVFDLDRKRLHAMKGPHRKNGNFWRGRGITGNILSGEKNAALSPGMERHYDLIKLPYL